MKRSPASPSPSPAAVAGKPVAGALRISVLGCGRVGLVIAAGLARFGHRVSAIDKDAAKLDELRRGELTFHEDGLAVLLREQVAAGRLAFSADATAALPDADIVFIAVGTAARSDGSRALDSLDEVVPQMCTLLRPDCVVVLNSTVPVGTARRIQASFAVGHDAAAAPCVLSNPQFMRTGSALQDFLQPDRILVGVDGVGVTGATCETALGLLRRVYRPLIEQGVPMLTMDTCSAELAKSAGNAMLAMRISFVNEIAAIAAATGADIERVCDAIGSDHRIGRECLKAGVGYGGAFFPEDVAALRHTARQHSLRSDLLHATERVNGRQRSWSFDALQRDLGGSVAMRGMRIAVWGLAFKPGTDDMREAPSLALIERLIRAGVNLQLYDPAAMGNARAVLPADRRLAWADSAAAALAHADALMLVTDWQEFVAFDPQLVAQALRLRVVYDGRNALDLPRWTAAGLRVVQVGRPDAGRKQATQRDMIAAVTPAAHAPSPSVSTHVALAAALR